jgi:Stress responsive A/B Barrel Domain
MIERVVLIKLKPEYATDEQRRAIAETTSTTLPAAQGVRALRVAIAADARTRREWDICIEVVLDDVDAVERYRVDPVHRAYADEFLGPLKQKIHVYNFERHPLAP